MVAQTQKLIIMLKVTQNKGFSLTFENNLTISVQFGSYNYCDRRGFDQTYGSERDTLIVESSNAEIAIWDKEDKWFNFGSDVEKGWCTANEVAEWIEKVSKANELSDIIK